MASSEGTVPSSAVGGQTSPGMAGTETAPAGYTMSGAGTPVITSASTAPAPACPTSTAELCGSNSDTATTCSSSGGYTYDTTCGVEYEGTVINTDIVSKMMKRATEPTLQDCQNLCDDYINCVAFNYIGTNCTLLSSVTGDSYTPGAVAGAITQTPPDSTHSQAPPSAVYMPSYTATITSSATPAPTPTCPGWAGQTYNDTDNTPYVIECDSDYAGNNIGQQISESDFTACLTFCDTLSGCDGVEYDTIGGMCYLKSSFDGTETAANGFIVGRKDLPIVSASVAAASSAPGAPGGYGGGGVNTVTPTMTPSITSTLCKQFFMTIDYRC